MLKYYQSEEIYILTSFEMRNVKNIIHNNYCFFIKAKIIKKL